MWLSISSKFQSYCDEVVNDEKRSRYSEDIRSPNSEGPGVS